MATTYIEATFLGEQAPYTTGHTYQLMIDQHWRGMYTVTATHGYEHKPVADTMTTYGSLEALLSDWRVVSVTPAKDVAW
jgi:hypothetical protein